MPRIPDHILKQSQGAPGSAAGIGSTMMQTVQAAAGLTNAALKGADQIVGVFEEQQKLANEQQILSTRNEMRDSLSNFENNLDPTAPDTWLGDFDKNAGTFKSKFQARDLAPVVKDRIKADGEEMFSRARRSIAKAALQKSTSNTRALYQDEINFNKARGDFGGANQGLDDAYAAKLLDPADYKQKKRELANFEARYHFENAIEKDPDAAAEAIDSPNFIENNPHLTLQDQDQLQRIVTVKKNEQNAEFWKGIADASLDEENPSVLGLKDLNELTKNGKITHTQRAAYIRAHHSEGSHKPDPAVYSRVAQALRAYDPNKDPDGYQLANLRSQLATLALPKEHLKELGKILTEVADKDSSSSTKHTQIKKNFSEATGYKFEEGHFGGWFEMTDHDDNRDTAKKKTIKINDFTRAAASRAKFVTAWERYLEKAPADLDPLKAAEDFDKMFEDIIINNGPSPLSPETKLKEQSYDQDVNERYPIQKETASSSFDVNGSDYDYESAVAAGLRPGRDGHWPSRVPGSGLVLKAKNHPTYGKAEAADKKLGYKFYTIDGRTYSLENPPKGNTAKPNKRTSKVDGATYNLNFSTKAGRREIFRAGGAPILLDTNFTTGGGGITQPLVVIPDNATDGQRTAAKAYADQIAAYLNPKLGRKMKGRVITRSENGRGRSDAFHTEPFALSDPAALRLMTSAKGMADHRKILQRTLGSLKGAQFFLPHEDGDPGATGNGTTEVQHARELLRGLFKTDLPEGAMLDDRDAAQRAWFDYAKPTSPAEIAAGLEELDIMRTLSRHA